ncbi:nuclear envelope phosphatase-regulatory subunit 1-like [Oppia nitens]|uniref:nuclear envelope phosphatase-regulatory subunit 1-like n=1 Tax=Oppia nitens TaxID=1686743 RepID=UPI0023D979BA|nr:nuclear envelope phosphatase-regulatory subunit 1-like [Oppia nitens]
MFGLKTDTKETIMSCDVTQEDLKAFERRLTEVIACLEPQTRKWRILLVVISLATLIGGIQWVSDPITSQVSFIESLVNHLFFTTSCILLTTLFIFGVHRKVVTPQVIVSRVRSVLHDFNMSCDDCGRLILKAHSQSSRSSSMARH